MRIEDSRALAAGFEARYPFIKVDIFRAGGEQIVNRAIAEHLAGKTSYDVLNAFALKLYKTKGCCNPTPRRKRRIILPGLEILNTIGYRSTAAIT